MSNKILRHIPAAITKLHKHILPIKASNVWITNHDGAIYLDLTSGIGALSTGHSHPHIIRKVKTQLESLVHIPQQVFKSHPAQIELTEKLIKIMPDKSLDNIFYVNSGSEATDNAIKIARRYTNKTNIIAMSRGFHGRSIGALSVTSSNIACKYKLQPLMPGVFFCPDFTKESIDQILTHNTDPDETAAIIVEPILGEAGIISIPEEFLSYIQNICNQHNIMFICDEVQCGSGRTGTWWNIEQKNVIPDIMTFGKGIASGFPLAGVVSRSEIMNTIDKGCLGGTYGGNAIASAAASATIDVIQNEKLLENTILMGNFLYKELKKINNIKDIRQYGLMIGIELDDNIPVNTIVDKLRERGILVLTAGTKGANIRLLPPLNISKIQLVHFINQFKDIMAPYLP
jgi:4-aminobutyrate aminotransferase-like enzyme